MAFIRITCPDCSLSREVPEEKLPDRPVQVTCPRCKGSFTFIKSAERETAAGLFRDASADVAASPAAAAAPAALPDRAAAALPAAAEPKSQPPVRQRPRAGTPPAGRPPAAASPAVSEAKGFPWQRLRIALLLLLLVSVIYQLREQIPFLQKVRLPVKVRQVITIPPPAGPSPATLPAGSITLQPAPVVPQAESAAPPSTPMPPSSGKSLAPFDLSVFIYAVNAPGRVRVNGQDFREIKAERDMQYNINAFGDHFHYGSNTIEFELSPQQGGGHFPPQLHMTVSRTFGSERRTIGEWRLSDREGWKKSVSLEIPEVTTP